MKNVYPNIVIYDGECLVCNRFVQFLLKIDKKKQLYYTSSDSEYFSKNLSQFKLPRLDRTVWFYSEGVFYDKSDAVIKILTVLGKPYSLAVILRFIPWIIRDSVYDFISRNRYRFNRKKTTCIIPDEDQKERILP